MNIKYDRRYLFVMMILLTIIFYTVPMALPVIVHPWEQSYVDTLNKLKPGDTVMWIHGSSSGSEPDIIDGCIVTLKYFMQKKVRIIMFGCVNVEETTLIQAILDRIGIAKVYTYGVDYVNFGWISGASGGAPAMYAMATNVKSILKVDAYMNGLDKLPIMNNINKIEDVALIVGGYQTPWFGALAGHGVPILFLSAAALETASLYLSTGLIQGFSGSVAGALVLETLLGIPGGASMSNNVISAGLILTLTALILGNITMLVKKKQTIQNIKREQ